MKRIIATLIALALVAGMAHAQDTTIVPLKENALQGYLMFSGWSGDKFASLNGGVKLGTIISLDDSRKLFLRTGYASLNWGDGLIQSIEVCPTLTWYLGQKWTFYALGGLSGYVSGDNSGLDAVGGFGCSRRVWTSKMPAVVPASLDLFAEAILTQSRDQATGGTAQINVGIKFGKAE